MSDKRKMSRRQFGGLAAGAMAAPLLARDTTGSSRPAGPERPKGGAGSKPGLNILFVFTDQERYVRKWPAGLDLPTHERLERTGVTFEKGRAGVPIRVNREPVVECAIRVRQAS